MRKSIVAGFISLALASTALIGAPAQAVTENRTTSVSIEVSYTKVEYGRTIWVTPTVTDNAGKKVYDGAVTLQSKVKGGAWKTVATNDRASASFWDLKPAEHTAYRALYAGYAAQYSFENNYTPSTSAETTVKVARTITSKKVKGKNFTVKGKVSPDFKKKKLVIKVAKKEKGKYKKYKVVRTNAKGVYKVSFPRVKGTRYWKIIVPADSRRSKTYTGWRTWVS